jgi:hypothetical protein
MKPISSPKAANQSHRPKEEDRPKADQLPALVIEVRPTPALERLLAAGGRIVEISGPKVH